MEIDKNSEMTFHHETTTKRLKQNINSRLTPKPGQMEATEGAIGVAETEGNRKNEDGR